MDTNTKKKKKNSHIQYIALLLWDGTEPVDTVTNTQYSDRREQRLRGRRAVEWEGRRESSELSSVIILPLQIKDVAGLSPWHMQRDHCWCSHTHSCAETLTLNVPTTKSEYNNGAYVTVDFLNPYTRRWIVWLLLTMTQDLNCFISI